MGKCKAPHCRIPVYISGGDPQGRLSHSHSSNLHKGLIPDWRKMRSACDPLWKRGGVTCQVCAFSK